MFPIASPRAPWRGATLGTALLALSILAVPGDSLARTEIITPTGSDPVQNCAALQTVIDAITDSTRDNPYLIKLEPGRYACGADPIDLPPYVELEGSGRTITVIEAENPGETRETAGAVRLNDYTTLRDLTVQNIVAGQAPRAYAVFARGVEGARISDVTARVETGRGAHAQAIRFAGAGDLTVDRVHAVADSRARHTCGIFATVGGNREGVLTLSNVVAEAADGDGTRIGLCARAQAGRKLQVHVRDSVLAGPYGSVLDTGGHVTIAHSQLIGPLPPLPPIDTATGQEVVLKLRDNVGPEQVKFYKPAVAPMPDGGYVVAWYAETLSADPRTVHVQMQRYDATGAPFGPEFGFGENLPLPANWLSSGGPPIALATLQNGDVMVFWTAQDDQGIDFAGRRVRRMGGVDTVIGPDLVFYDGADGDGKSERDPVVAGMSDGGSVVAWCADGPGGTTREVYARRFDGNGYSIWPRQEVATTELINPGEPDPAWQVRSKHCQPAIAGLPDGGFVVAWETVGHMVAPDVANKTVFARRYTPGAFNQILPGDTQPVPQHQAGHQVSPSVAALAGGGHAIAWGSSANWWQVEPNPDYGTLPDFDMATRFYPPAGSPGDEIAADPSTAYGGPNDLLRQRNNDVAGLADGGFAAVWQSAQAMRIDGRLFAADGAPIGTVFQVSQNVPDETGSVTSGAGWPSAAALSDGGLVVVWEHQRSVWARVFADAYGPRCVHAYDNAYEPLDADCRPGVVATSAGPRM